MFKLRIKEIRESKSIKQEDLAKALKVHQVQISKWELGKQIPSLTRTIEIAEVLGVTVEELLEYKKIHGELGKLYKDMGKTNKQVK